MRAPNCRGSMCCYSHLREKNKTKAKSNLATQKFQHHSVCPVKAAQSDRNAAWTHISKTASHLSRPTVYSSSRP